MAYAVHWQINFVALHSNDAYRVDILEDGYSEDVVHLRGAANPFETTEDNSDDAFTPIRKQTGSLRIADNGYDMDGSQTVRDNKENGVLNSFDNSSYVQAGWVFDDKNKCLN